jgi:nucleoside phosphorylase
MRIFLIGLILSAGIFAQNPGVECKLSMQSSVVVKGLYGGKVGVSPADLSCKNYSPTPQLVGLTDIDLSLATINTVNAADATALFTSQFNKQVAPTLGRVSTGISTGLMAATAVNSVKISASSISYIGLGASLITEVLIPLIAPAQPSLPALLANQCGQVLQNAATIASQGELHCRWYVQVPPKKSTIPSTIVFVVDPSNVTPSPLPNPVPLGLKKIGK